MIVVLQCNTLILLTYVFVLIIKRKIMVKNICRDKVYTGRLLEKICQKRGGDLKSNCNFSGVLRDAI